MCSSDLVRQVDRQQPTAARCLACQDWHQTGETVLPTERPTNRTEPQPDVEPEPVAEPEVVEDGAFPFGLKGITVNVYEVFDANPSKTKDVPTPTVFVYVVGVVVIVYPVAAAASAVGIDHETVTAAPTPDAGVELDAVAVYGLAVPTSVAVTDASAAGSKKSFDC